MFFRCVDAFVLLQIPSASICFPNLPCFSPYLHQPNQSPHSHHHPFSIQLHSEHSKYVPSQTTFTISGEQATRSQPTSQATQHIPAIPTPAPSPCIAPQHAACHEGRGSAQRVADGAAHGALLGAAAPAVHLADAAAGGTQRMDAWGEWAEEFGGTTDEF